MQFLVQYGKFVIGLHIRSNEPWTRAGFHWEDGSPLDFDGWDHETPNQPDNQLPPERNVEFRNNFQRFGWHDLPLIYFEAVVCKITLRSYGLLPQNPYTPVNPSYPYPPNQIGQLQPQQTPQPHFAVVATQLPGIVQNPNSNAIQQIAAPPAEVIIEPSEILVVNPGAEVVAAATPSVINVSPPVYQ
uniref:C-type lectin domain-containing protein n=1 Tax=Panagrolaimus sp. ES5 TaxID=591445 RepID=A0AC34GY47_9BILA